MNYIKVITSALLEGFEVCNCNEQNGLYACS